MNDDVNNWITGLSHAVGQAPPLAAFGYAYDNEGNKLYEEKLHQPGNSEAYGYDAINRLTGFAAGQLSGGQIPAPTTQSAWNLDPVGNWNSKVKDGVTENRAHNNANEITAISGNAVLSDNNGNITQDLQNQYQYDEGNRLVSVFSLQSSVLSQYCYDALGRRISKTTAAGTTVFYYDAARIIEERVGGATTASYIYGNYVDEVLAKDSAAQRLFYHQNALWSVHALTDANGNVVERYSYDAYGQLSVLDPNYQLLSTPPLAYFTFTGREFDAECGIFHYRARCYSPSLGRFLQRDPLSYVDGMNLYEYVGSSPSMFVDPSGNTSIMPFLPSGNPNDPLASERPLPFIGEDLLGDENREYYTPQALGTGLADHWSRGGGQIWTKGANVLKNDSAVQNSVRVYLQQQFVPVCKKAVQDNGTVEGTVNASISNVLAGDSQFLTQTINGAKKFGVRGTYTGQPGDDCRCTVTFNLLYMWIDDTYLHPDKFPDSVMIQMQKVGMGTPYEIHIKWRAETELKGQHKEGVKFISVSGWPW